jgi:hypothetical protein
MPRGQRPLPTKREMHTNHQTSALTCREAAQFNHALQRTRPSRSGCNPRLPRAGSLSLGRWMTCPLNTVGRLVLGSPGSDSSSSPCSTSFAIPIRSTRREVRSHDRGQSKAAVLASVARSHRQIGFDPSREHRGHPTLRCRQRLEPSDLRMFVPASLVMDWPAAPELGRSAWNTPPS